MAGVGVVLLKIVHLFHPMIVQYPSIRSMMVQTLFEKKSFIKKMSTSFVNIFFNHINMEEGTNRPSSSGPTGTSPEEGKDLTETYNKLRFEDNHFINWHGLVVFKIWDHLPLLILWVTREKTRPESHPSL